MRHRRPGRAARPGGSLTSSGGPGVRSSGWCGARGAARRQPRSGRPDTAAPLADDTAHRPTSVLTRWGGVARGHRRPDERRRMSTEPGLRAG